MSNICGLNAKDVQFLEQDFEYEIKECCSKHMPKYVKLKEGLPNTRKELCALNGEMIMIAHKILRKIDIVDSLVRSMGSKEDVKRIANRRAFVTGVLEMLVNDSTKCR